MVPKTEFPVTRFRTSNSWNHRGVEVDGYQIHDLEGVAYQRPDGHYPPLEWTQYASCWAAVAGYLLVNVPADAQGEARREMFVDVPLEVPADEQR